MLLQMVNVTSYHLIRRTLPISDDANHFSLSFKTVLNAPIMIGTTVTLRNFQIHFNSHFRSNSSSQFSLSLSPRC